MKVLRTSFSSDTPTLEEVASFLDTYWDAFSKVYSKPDKKTFVENSLLVIQRIPKLAFTCQWHLTEYRRLKAGPSAWPEPRDFRLYSTVVVSRGLLSLIPATSGMTDSDSFTHVWARHRTRMCQGLVHNMLHVTNAS